MNHDSELSCSIQVAKLPMKNHYLGHFYTNILFCSNYKVNCIEAQNQKKKKFNTIC